ncbi:MAG: DUF692 family protein [Saprospiraceae bacterium]|nr:DUF692 family protein [Saprospiraceae bacterium]
MSKIHSSIACNLDANMLLASLPLFASEKVQAIEWSFDTLYKHRHIPDWFVELLQAYSAENRLIGHGVYFSLFSGKWSPDQQAWLDHLSRLSTNFNFDHITEHFGFMTGEDFHRGAPLSLPFTTKTLLLGQDRLKRMQEACGCPVGLENLAFAYSLEEVEQHGAFLEALVEPVNGFIILDLHNLYCQLHNFDVSFDDIIKRYPLDRVREIHISGGSWEPSRQKPEKSIRRDTHDDAVPEAVFELLEQSLMLCPNLKYVVLEQLGIGLASEDSKQQFQADFYRMERLVEAYNLSLAPQSAISFLPVQAFESSSRPAVEDMQLYQEQQVLSRLLEDSTDLESFQAGLNNSILAHSDWRIETWAPEMLETAYQIAQKWKKGFA